jgi:nucleotide-binding universal stress UspA family protein
LGDASRSALRALADWPDLQLNIAHVAWPFGEHYRLGVQGPMPLDHLRPEVHHQVMNDLQRWADPVLCQSPPKLSVLAGWGRIDTHLAQLAAESEADLLVVGSHQRNLAARVWQGSVARSAIREATCNVLCVPNRLVPTQVGNAPKLLVIPTDFSALGDRAVSYGYGLAGPGSTVHLVHVASTLDEAQKAALTAELSARIPARAKDLGIDSQVHVLEGGSAWLSIWQHAGRVGADLICMATHSRDAVGRLVVGSQAQALLEHTRTPVVLVPPDRES